MRDPAEIAAAKVRLRSEMEIRVRALSDAERRAASRQANARLLALEEIETAGAVLFYMAMRRELDPFGTMQECLRAGVRIAVPAVDDASNELEAIAIESLDDRHFAPDRFGVLVPRAGERIRATEFDAVVVPGVAFDRVGRRLGRGAGFYDRLLVRLPERCRTIGFAYQCQLIDAVPAESHDQRVGAVVTPDESIST